MNDIGVIMARNGRGFCVVDQELHERLNHFRWRQDSNGYFARSAKTNGRFRHILMHRYIMATPDGMHTDHINGVRHDNRSCNLRLATPSQNLTQNARKHRDSNSVSTSKYKGVHRVVRAGIPENKWRAKFKRQDLGIYLVEADAAVAYNKAAKEAWGEFAFQNVIE